MSDAAAAGIEDPAGNVRRRGERASSEADVMSLKEAEQALRESQQRYRRLLEAITSYRYSVEVRDGRAISTRHSEGCLAATGCAPEDYASDPYLWITMVHPDDREMVRRHAAEVLSNKDVPPLEHRIVHRDGRTRWVCDTIVPHRDAEGRLVRYDGLVDDVTERKRVEERLRRVVELAPDGMVVVDGRGKIVLVRRADGEDVRLRPRGAARAGRGGARRGAIRTGTSRIARPMPRSLLRGRWPRAPTCAASARTAAISRGDRPESDRDGRGGPRLLVDPQCSRAQATEAIAHEDEVQLVAAQRNSSSTSCRPSLPSCPALTWPGPRTPPS